MIRTSNIAFIIPSQYYCAIFNSLDASIRVSNSLDPDQARHFVEEKIINFISFYLFFDGPLLRCFGPMTAVSISDIFVN